ncbi:MAG: nuclear transport factor 2 family protein [Muricauda sp.]|nr:nuclear transport factor 2 family protein [Allomuricauda sp.]
MKLSIALNISFFSLCTISVMAQTQKDTLEITQVALDYIESQHNVNPAQFERAAHPRMVKRTFWTNKTTGKEYLRETFTDAMILLAETYNKDGDRFPENPKKEVVILDIFDRTASVKLIADDWIDYMHIVKLNGKWQLVNVLWQFNDASSH